MKSTFPASMSSIHCEHYGKSVSRSRLPPSAGITGCDPLLIFVTDRFREVKMPPVFAVRVLGVAMAVKSHRFYRYLGDKRALARATVNGIARSTSGGRQRGL